MPLRSIAFLLYFFGSSAGALAWPMVGVICYLVLYHVFPESTWWGISLSPLGLRYSLICGTCLLIGTILNLGRLSFGRRALHPVECALLLMFLAMVISTYTGAPWDRWTEYVLDKMSKVFLFSLMFSHVVVTRRRLWQLAILLTIMALYLGHEARNAPPSAFTVNRLDGIGGPDFRESASLAIHLFALLPFVVIVLRQKSWWMRVLAFFAGAYAVNAVLLCRARSALVAGVVAGVVALWYVPRRHRRWITCMLVLGAVGGITLSDNWFWDRMGTIFSSSDERDLSASSRLDIWAAAWTMIKDHPLGVGVGHFASQIGQYGGDIVEKRDAHNTYVLCASEIGIPGLLLYLGTIYLAWYALGLASRNVKRQLGGDDKLEMFILASRLALVVYLVSGLFVSRFYTEGAWFFIVLPVCISRAVENEIREQSLQTSTHEPDALPAEVSPTLTGLAPSGVYARG